MFDKNYNGVAMLVAVVIDQQVMEEKYTNSNSQGAGFKPNGFINWLQQKGSANYLQINPYTKSRSKSIVNRGGN